MNTLILGILLAIVPAEERHYRDDIPSWTVGAQVSSQKGDTRTYRNLFYWDTRSKERTHKFMYGWYGGFDVKKERYDFYFRYYNSAGW